VLHVLIAHLHLSSRLGGLSVLGQIMSIHAGMKISASTFKRRL